MSVPNAANKRIVSLDQFRGYTVAGMFLVNFLSPFVAAPFVLKHHSSYCSYADTIMGNFLFAVGFAFRLSFGRRAIQQGLAQAYWHVLKRLIGLALVAVVVYQGSPQLPKGAEFNWETMKDLGVWGALSGPLKRDWFQTLMHIAVTSLWILPVIRAGAPWRVVYLILSALIHMGLSQAFCMEWVNRDPSGVDGGPLAFLTWSIPAIIGTLACDLVMSSRNRVTILGSLFCSGLFLIALGWIASCGSRCYDVPDDQVAALQGQRLSASPVIPRQADWIRWSNDLKNGNWAKVLAEPPFVAPPHSRQANGDKNSDYRKWNYWMMSTRFVTISYAAFVSGLSLILYAFFIVTSDLGGLSIRVFRTLGSNALFAYVLHDIVGDAVKKFVPRDAPPVAMWISFAVFFSICWLFVRSLEKKNIYIKL